MSSYNQYGTCRGRLWDGNTVRRELSRLPQAFVDAHKAPFLSKNRVWIGSYGLLGTDVNDFNNLLNSEGMEHSTEVPTRMAHRWDSGWVPVALSALYEDSQNLAWKRSPESP